VRDILVEKENQQKHEGRAIKALNRAFDAVLVHSDPKLFKLEETFFRFDEIRIPIVYTGFIAQPSPPGARKSVRMQLGLIDTQKLIVASAGGGSVGAALLKSVVDAFHRLSGGSDNHLHVYTGPYVSAKEFDSLRRKAGSRVFIGKFSTDFLSYLAAADLSISMAGYNTSMNILATRVRSLVWPFSQNHEQTLRAAKLAEIGALKVLGKRDLEPDRLARIIDISLLQGSSADFDVNLYGAAATAEWLERWNPEKSSV
jgi:predicted glycosyltransferase